MSKKKKKKRRGKAQKAKIRRKQEHARMMGHGPRPERREGIDDGQVFMDATLLSLFMRRRGRGKKPEDEEKETKEGGKVDG